MIMTNIHSTRNPIHVLVVEDDAGVSNSIAKMLREQGHTADTTADGQTGLAMASSGPYDVMIIDRMLPGIDGLTLLRNLRAGNNFTPALILSALGEVDDRVQGLHAGGDDYLVKPFAFIELLARLEALARRGQQRTQSDIVLQAGEIVIDLLARKVTRGSETVQLQAREFKLLEFLLRHKNQIVTRAMLLEHVWEYHFDPQTNVIDVHISRLRQKIDRDPANSVIKTIRGAGYTIEDAPAESA